MASNDPASVIPLAAVFQAANDLVLEGLIENWALGGALAAVYYVEPFTTYGADVFFTPRDQTLSAGLAEIYSFLQARGWSVEREHLLVQGFPVQFLVAHGLTEEAVKEAEPMEYQEVPGRVFRAEHIIAIAAMVGRTKDKVRIELLLQQTGINKQLLDEILQKYNLKLPIL